MHSDKYGILAPAQKRLAATASIGNQNLDPQITIEQQFKSLIKPAETVDSFEELPDEFFSKEFNINSSKQIQPKNLKPSSNKFKLLQLLKDMLILIINRQKLVNCIH